MDGDTPRGLLGLLGAEGGLDAASSHHDATLHPRSGLSLGLGGLASEGWRWGEGREAVERRQARVGICATITLRCGRMRGGGSGDRG